MVIAVIGAMDEEIEHLKNKMTNQDEINIANVNFIKGILHKKEIILLKSGIGKVNAAMATTVLMEKFRPTFVINTGTAGGINEDLAVGQIVVADEVVHHDVDVTAFGYQLGQVPQLPPTFPADPLLFKKVQSILQKLMIPNKTGLIGTGDTFMQDDNKIMILKENFPGILAVEMEGAAIAQVCYQYGVPFILIRAISDIAGRDSSMSFREFIDVAARNTTKTIEKFILT